jgi:hypothetical protein
LVERRVEVIYQEEDEALRTSAKLVPTIGNIMETSKMSSMWRSHLL